MAKSTLLRLVLVALLVRLLVIGLTYAAPRALALRDYAANRGRCASLRELVYRRPQCAVLAEDETGYDALGRSIAAGHGFQLEQGWVIAQAGTPTAYGGFLYPAFVGAVYAASGNNALVLFVLQAVIGSLAVAGIAAAAFRLGGERAGLAAGAIAVIHPGLALDSAWVMSEALAMPLLLAAYLLWLRYLERQTVGRACAFGAAAAAACLTRSPAFYALGLMAVLSLPWRVMAWRRTAGGLVVAGVVFAACLAPWVARNDRVFHAIVPFDTKAGAGLWLNDHPGAHPFREVWDGAPDPQPPPGPVPGLNEAQADEHFRALTLQYLRDQPLTFAGVAAMRLALALVPVPRYWGRWAAARAVAAALYIALTWLALAGLWRVRRTPAGRALIGVAGGWLVMMACTAVGLRHRLAAEWAFTASAGVALAALLEARAARRGAAPQQPRR